MCHAEKAAEVLADKMNFIMDPDELNQAFKDMDTDGDGEIDYKEFATWWKSMALNKTGTYCGVLNRAPIV